MVSECKGSSTFNKAHSVHSDISELNSILDEDALYEKIGKILNQLDVTEINNEIETQKSKIENEAEKYFANEEHERFIFRWFIPDKIFVPPNITVLTDRDFLCYTQECVEPSLMDFQYYNNEGGPPTILSFMSLR